MHTLSLNPGKEGLKLLCLGAHCDDIEIGCGGTLLRLFKEYKIAEIKWVVFASNEIRAKEARRSAEMWLEGVDNHEIIIYDFRDALLNFSALEIKEKFEALKIFNPDLVFTHYRNDRHQDHRLLSDLAWNTFRSHTILEYEIPKYDGDLGQPNVYVGLEKEILQKKIEILMEAFPTQAQKHWFDEETFSALPRLRGMESVSRYAEAFYVRKMCL